MRLNAEASLSLDLCGSATGADANQRRWPMPLTKKGQEEEGQKMMLDYLAARMAQVFIVVVSFIVFADAVVNGVY